MRWRALMLLGLAAMLGACGSIDGGSSGTGITTTEGNVLQVVTDAAAALSSASSAPGAGAGLGMAMTEAPASLAGIEVAIEGTASSATTDEAGSFQIRGRFPAVFTVVFSRTDVGTLGRVTVTIPGGGTLTLNDVTIATGQQSATPASQDAVFHCTVAQTDCAGGTMSFVNAGANYAEGQYVLELAGSSLQNPMGAAVACADLQPGDYASVRGQAFPDLTFGNAVVTVSP